MRFVIVTGVSGAGKSQAIRCLEDMGYYCIDNIPPALITKFAEICFSSGGKIEKAAMVIDIRGGELFSELFNNLKELEETGFSYEILYLEANSETLVKRYKETRRKHPLAVNGEILQGINKERDLLKEAKDKSNHIIDTSNISPQELKEKLINIFSDNNKYEGLMIDIVSFGFKYGIPIDADLVFDVRFLPNPYYIAELKDQTGLDEDVEKYVMKNKQTKEFINKLNDMIEFLIPKYYEEGKSQLVIGIGCTGGKHRSVAIANNLYKHLLCHEHRTVIRHRDISKDM